MLCLVTVGLIAFSIPASASVRTRSQPRPLVRNVTDFIDRSHTVVPAALPVPSTGDGIGPGTLLFTTIPNEGTFQCTGAFVFRGETPPPATPPEATPTQGTPPEGTPQEATPTQATPTVVASSEAPKLYLGAAGHCFLPPDKKATHGPNADYDASGVVVRACVSGCTFGGFTGQVIQGNFVQLGSVAYARSGGIGDDFGLVTIPPELASRVHAGVPVWGGPSRVSDDVTGFVCYFGRGIVFGEVFPTMGRIGYGLGADPDGSFTAAGALGSGDSGAALETCTPGGDAQAAGIITHGAGMTEPAVTGIIFGTTVRKAIAMAAGDAVLTISVVLAS